MSEILIPDNIMEEVIEYDNSHASSLAQFLSQSIIGEEHQMQEVAEEIIPWLDGFTTPQKPLVLLFIGPSGTGKTQTAKAISQLAFEREDGFVRINGGDLQERHEISSLIGSPNGYVGSDKSGIFEKYKDYFASKRSILLVDEVEKASGAVHKLLLSIMDDGIVTCKNPPQTEVIFKNTLIIMTSNTGSELVAQLLRGSSMGFASHNAQSLQNQTMKKIAMAEMKRTFTPEFRGRISHTICFDALSYEALEQITASLQRELWADFSKIPVYIDMHKDVVAHLASIAYLPQNRDMGVRLIRDRIAIDIKNKLYNAIRSGKVPRGGVVRAFLTDKGIELRRASNLLILPSKETEEPKDVPPKDDPPTPSSPTEPNEPTKEDAA